MKPLPRRWLAHLLGATTIGLLAAAQPAWSAVDLGDASVLSQRGQRLKIAIPYGAAPGERVSVSRFVVKSVVVPAGYPSVPADSFTLSKGDRHNVVFVQSREPIGAPGVKIVMDVQDGESRPIAYDLTVPPNRVAVAMPGDMPTMQKVSAKARKRGARSGGSADSTTSGTSARSADGGLTVDESAALLVPGGRQWR